MSLEEIHRDLVHQDLVRTQVTTIGTSATAVLTAALDNRRSIRIQNTSADTLAIGGAAVTMVNGFFVAPDTSITLAAGAGVLIFGVSDDVITVRILEQS